MSLILLIFVAALEIVQVQSYVDIGFDDDEDLTRFVTRPDIKAPLFEVSNYEPNKITPGYWFVAPYAYIEQESHARNYYQPCQTGPHIYDGGGNLVWSGACMFKNQNMCDFRPWCIDNSWLLSGILTTYLHGGDSTGHGVILDNSFETRHVLNKPEDTPAFNMHELQLHDNGKLATHLLGKPLPRSVGPPSPGHSTLGPVLDVGIREMDIATNETTFVWWGLSQGHLSLAESRKPLDVTSTGRPVFWDWFHANSIDKNHEGDYLLSSRYTDTIYKISHQDGSILWHLGGTNTSFIHDFNFSRQHDARWILTTPNREIISFLNNDADLEDQRTDHSSALLVEIDKSTVPMTARKLRDIVRPDKSLSRRRGNHQVLSNGNSFICWSDNAYISEHTEDGQVIMEARFRSDRFTTYRAYKSNFTGSPAEPPVVIAFVYGISPQCSTTVAYVSWNGATEVDLWKLFAQGDEDKMTDIGQGNKTSFEDVIQSNGCHEEVLVEGYDIRGQPIGRSLKVRAQLPTSWDRKTCDYRDWASSVNDDYCEKSGHTLSQVCCLSYRPGSYLVVGLFIVATLAGLARKRPYKWLHYCATAARHTAEKTGMF